MSEQPKEEKASNEEKKQVEEKAKEEAKKPDEEKTKEELLIEIKNLRIELEKLNEEKEMVEADNQMKAMNISFLEQTNVLQNNRINEYRKTISQMKQEIEDLKKMKADEYFKKKDEETKEEEEEYNEEEIKNAEVMKLKFAKDIAKNGPDYSGASQMFAVFKSLKGDAILAWPTKERSLELYDLEKETLIKSIKNAHSSEIYCVRHFVDIKSNSDLLITSSYDKSLKIWNIENNDTPLLTIENAHSNGFSFSPCILSNEKLSENYIISGADDEYIKIFDFKGKFLDKQIKVGDYVNFLDTYYETEKGKIFIINGTSRGLKVHDFDDCSIYNTYYEKEQSAHAYIILYKNESKNRMELIDADMKGFIRIWDFHSAKLLKTIKMETIVNGICLWDNRYLATSGRDTLIKLVDLRSKKIIKKLSGHEKETLSVKKIHLSKYGDCLVSLDRNGIIKLWSL